MERDKLMLENFINNWNGDFPEYELKAADLKEPPALMGALVQVFDRLGIDRAVLSESPEGNLNESMQYYRDLLPVINMTRVVNHLVSVMPQVAKINMTHFLQPTVMTSHSILLLLFNLMVFNEDKLRDIAPDEEQLFAKSEEVNKLADKKHKLQELLNEQAQENALRADRLDALELTTKQLEEELREETAACNAEQLAVDEALEQHRQTEVMLDQKKTARDALLADIEKKKALRVYDAEDVMAQVEQSTRGVQELDERWRAARATLVLKEEALRNLANTKSCLDTANTLLRDLAAAADTLSQDGGDLDADSAEGELGVLGAELADLGAAARELGAAREQLRARTAAAAAARAAQRSAAHSTLREATEQFKKNSERCVAGQRRTEELKLLTEQHQRDKEQGLADIRAIHTQLQNRIQSTEELLVSQMMNLAKRAGDKNKKI